MNQTFALIGFWACLLLACSLTYWAVAASFRTPTDRQARQWLVTLDPSKRASGQPWQAEISATSYDRARATARERFSWADDTFSVTPVTSDYVDQREIRYTP